MIKTLPQTRGRDNHGAGYYGASRGSRFHNGVDFVFSCNDEVRAFVPGEVTKLGYAYASDLKWRYVEIRTRDNRYNRYFYVNPGVEVGQKIHEGEVIGCAQGIENKYPGMTPHVHFEAFGGKANGKPIYYLDPIKYLSGDA